MERPAEHATTVQLHHQVTKYGETKMEIWILDGRFDSFELGYTHRGEFGLSHGQQQQIRDEKE